MSDLVALVGAITPPGRLNRATAISVDQAKSSGLSAELISLGDRKIGNADGRPPAEHGDDTAATVQAIHGASAVIFGSPVYRGSFPGVLKNFLDHVPLQALQGKPVGLVVVGATYHHYLGVDRHLRDVLAWYGALVAPTSVYLVSADFTEGAPTPAAVAEVEALTDTVLKLRDVAGAALGPTPLAGRKG